MKQLLVKLQPSPDQVEVIIDHIVEETELGILESEYGYIRSKVTKGLAERGFTLLKILKANLNIEEAQWEVTCEIEDGNEKAQEIQVQSNGNGGTKAS